MKNISLILIGCGGVGRQLLRHIVACRDLHSNQGVRLRVVGVADSKSMVVATEAVITELEDGVLDKICRIKYDGGLLSSLESDGSYQVLSGSNLTIELIEIARRVAGLTGLAVIDCSASSDTIEVLKKLIGVGCCIVLANKKPLTSSMEDHDQLVSHPRHLRHESTVGAGLPVIVSINRLISSGDTISLVVGSLSGTLGYVLSEMEDGKPFSEVVRTAKDLGYTEPDPRDDLGGMDVARKALIIARLLGHRINLDDIEVESLYLEEMGPNTMALEKFLSDGLPLLDTDFKLRVERAASSGRVLRYVCMIGGSRLKVGIQEFPKSSPLGRLKGSDNLIEIYSRCYKEQPLVIQGAGAGNDTTAAGVLADILDLQDMF
ncbi:Bifunctional aspartokinase/homoserine dehydrogenase 1-like protein [Drosera capensis]